MEANLLNAIKTVKSNDFIRTQIGKSLNFAGKTVTDMDRYIDLVTMDLVATRDQKIAGVIVAKEKEKLKALMLFDDAVEASNGIAISALFRGIIEDEDGNTVTFSDVADVLNKLAGKKLFCSEQLDSPILKYRNEAGNLVPRTVYKFVLSK